MSASPRLTVDAVHHGVLKDVGLSAEPGAIFALTGHSGSGKSTLCHLLAGFERPEHGQVRLNGIPTADITDWAQIAVVPQRLALLGELTALENLLLPVLASRRSTETAQATEILDRMGVAALAARPVSLGSVGEQQRVATARALMLDAALVVLDEPTAHQDDENVGKVVDAVLAAAGRGSILVVSSHDPRLLRHATQTLALGSGL
jgi:ABC-type lipoprotein export system ATPase subunit